MSKPLLFVFVSISGDKDRGGQLHTIQQHMLVFHTHHGRFYLLIYFNAWCQIKLSVRNAVCRGHVVFVVHAPARGSQHSPLREWRSKRWGTEWHRTPETSRNQTSTNVWAEPARRCVSPPWSHTLPASGVTCVTRVSSFPVHYKIKVPGNPLALSLSHAMCQVVLIFDNTFLQ